MQGCTYPDLRARAAENVKQYNADGYAIGGLAVGEPTEVMYEMIEVVNAILPEDRPRYLMGVGTPVNILEGIERGVDMFDCVCGEMLAAEIASLHNIAFYLRLVGAAREHILAGDFRAWKEGMVEKLQRRL